MTDREKFLSAAKTYIGKTGNYVCNSKLGLGMVVDWCAYTVSAIMKDCGFIGKYQGGIYGFASDAARQDHGKYGEFFKKGVKAPQPGDYVMFRYSSFLNPIDIYSASHVGIVEAVNGNVLTTIEGNVDGWGSDWAGTSSCKRKTRYLSSSDVYSFYRPYWKNEGGTSGSSTSSKTETKVSSSEINILYQVYAGGKWLPEVRNLEDFAGEEGDPIQGIYMRTSKGHVKYRVKLAGSKKYLPWVTDTEDFAGIIGKNIERVQARFYGAGSNYQIEYRVANTGKGYLPWVRDFNTKNNDGYAGMPGKTIDKFQCRIVKK